MLSIRDNVDFKVRRTATVPAPLTIKLDVFWMKLCGLLMLAGLGIITGYVFWVIGLAVVWLGLLQVMELFQPESFK